MVNDLWALKLYNFVIKQELGLKSIGFHACRSLRTDIISTLPRDISRYAIASAWFMAVEVEWNIKNPAIA